MDGIPGRMRPAVQAAALDQLLQISGVQYGSVLDCACGIVLRRSGWRLASTSFSPEPRRPPYGVVQVDSTSEAARAAAAGEVDAALTTAPAAELHGLPFVTRTLYPHVVVGFIAVPSRHPKAPSRPGPQLLTGREVLRCE